MIHMQEHLVNFVPTCDNCIVIDDVKIEYISLILHSF